MSGMWNRVIVIAAPTNPRNLDHSKKRMNMPDLWFVLQVAPVAAPQVLAAPVATASAAAPAVKAAGAPPVGPPPVPGEESLTGDTQLSDTDDEEVQQDSSSDGGPAEVWPRSCLQDELSHCSGCTVLLGSLVMMASPVQKLASRLFWSQCSMVSASTMPWSLEYSVRADVRKNAGVFHTAVAETGGVQCERCGLAPAEGCWVREQ